MTTPSPPPRKLVPTSQPISLLITTEANVYTHVHPFLILILYYIRFPSLVASPVPTLLSSLIPLSILQITYTVLCLPPTANGSRSASTPSKKVKSKRGTAAKSHVGIGDKIVVSNPFTIDHEELTKYCHNPTAFASIPCPNHYSRRTALYSSSDPIRRPSDHSPTTYGALRYSYGITLSCPPVLRVRSGWEDVEGDLKR